MSFGEWIVIVFAGLFLLGIIIAVIEVISDVDVDDWFSSTNSNDFVKPPEPRITSHKNVTPPKSTSEVTKAYQSAMKTHQEKGRITPATVESDHAPSNDKPVITDAVVEEVKQDQGMGSILDIIDSADEIEARRLVYKQGSLKEDIIKATQDMSKKKKS